MKKMFKHTLIGFAMLIGLLVSGVSSASAEENSPLNHLDSMYDYDGNKIKVATVFSPIGDEYYLEPANEENESQGIVTQMWNRTTWAKLSYKSNAMTVKVHKNEHIPSNSLNWHDADSKDIPLAVDFKTNVTVNILDILDPIKKSYQRNMYLTAKPNGVQLIAYNEENAFRGEWIVYQKVQGGKHVYAFKSEDIGNFLTHREAGDWLRVDQSEMNENTLWKLVKK